LAQSARYSDAKNVACVVTKASNCTADETTSGFCGDSKAFANFTEALALAVEESKTGFDGVTSTWLEGSEEFAEEVAFNTDHHGIFWGGIAISHQVAEGCITVVTDGLVEADRGGEAVQLCI
jgi:hypothetical protein